MRKRIMAAVMAVVLMCGSVDTSLLVYATNVEDGAEEIVGEESLETESSEVEEPSEEEQENTAADDAEDEGESASSNEDSQPGDTEAVETEGTAEETVSSFGASNIASGTYGNVTWVIDGNGKLTVNGSGEISEKTGEYRAPWWSERNQITEAVINLSGTKDMSYLLHSCTNLKSVDLSGSDTSNTTDMSKMFLACYSLSSVDLSGLDTSNVMDMNSMFYNCNSLTSIDLSDLDTDSVENMGSMFYGCSSLTDIDLSSFNTGNVTNMGAMFSSCSSLTSLDLSGFNTGSVARMNNMFFDCSSLESIDLSGWDTSNATDMSGLFSSCSSLKSIDLSNLDTGNVTSMNSMFSNCSSLTAIDLRGLDTGNVTYMGGMFNGCSSLESIDLSGLNVENVTNMFKMLANCDSLTSVDLGALNTGNVTYMCNMFENCYSLSSVDLSGLDTSSVTDMSYMFSGCIDLTSVDLSGLNTRSLTSMEYMFFECFSLTSIDFDGMDTGSVTNMRGLFYDCRSLTSIDLSSFDTSSVTDMDVMFSQCGSLTSIDLSGLDTSCVTRMNSMFERCSSLTSLNLNGLDTRKVTLMSGMFANCSSLTSIDLSSLDTSKVTLMSGMFANCSSLTSIDLSSLDTSNVTDMSDMFGGCSGLTSIDLSSLDTSSVTIMSGMFGYCSSLTSIDLSVLDVSKVTNMYGMFEYCTSLTDINVKGLNVSRLRLIFWMFRGCSSLKSLDLSSWNLSSLETGSQDVFTNCGITRINAPLYLPSAASIELPSSTKSKWYKEDGTEVTTLPTGLKKSVLLYKNSLESTQYQDYVIAVYDADLGASISGVQITLDSCCYQTGTDGTVKISSTTGEYSDVTFVKSGYETKTTALNLKAGEINAIYMTAIMDVKVELPQIDDTVTLNDEITILGYTFNWLDLEMKLSLAPDSSEISKFPIKITADREKHSFKIIFGLENEEDGTGEDTNIEAYNDIKNLCNCINESNFSTKLNKFLDKQKLKFFESEWGVEVKMHVFGYAEIKVNEDGSCKLLEGGALIGLKGSGEITYRPAITLGILYFQAKLTLSAEGQLTLNFEHKSIAFEMVLNFEQALNLCGGLGDKHIAAIEVGAEGKLKETVDIPFVDIMHSLDFKFTAKVYASASFLGQTIEYPKELIDAQLWPRNSNNALLQAASISEEESADAWKMMDRDYLTSTYSRRTTVSTIESESTYPDGSPEMVRLADGSLLAVWITDNGSKSDENRTTLYYAVNEGSSWSTPTAVCETGRGDFYPSLFVDGDTAYLVWINIDHELDTEYTSEEVFASTDIYYAEFVDGAFSTPVLVTETENETMELNARVIADGTKSTVIWVQNSENDPYLVSGTNAIYARTCEDGVWGETVCVADNLNAISSYDTTYLDGVLNVAYIMDLDGSTDTDDDHEVFLYTDGTTSRVTSDSKSDSNVRFSDDMLYWSSNGEIMQMQVGSIRSTASTGVTGVSGFEILENGEEKAILILGADGFKSELYLARAEGDGFAAPIPATDFGLHIDDYAAVLQDDGSVTAMIFETEVIEDWEDSPYGTTALRVYDVLEAENLTLEDFYINEEDVEPDATVTAELTLYNESSTDLSAVTVSLSDGSNTLLNEKTVSCSIGAGEEGTVSADVTLDSDVSAKTLTATVTPVDYEDSDTSDNTLEQEIGYGDLALEIENAVVTVSDDGTATIEGKLVNNGYAEQSGVTIQLLKDGESGEAIYEYTYGAMAAGAETDFSITIASANLSFDNAYDGAYFQLVCSSESAERRYDNNSEIIVVFPIPVTGITVEQETMSLTVKERGQLTASVIPGNAANSTIYYTTDNSEVAVVDENGLITAAEEGTATITAITADGGYAASCVVTVAAAGAEETVYGLDTIALSLQKGESGQIGLIDQNGDAAADVSAVWSSSDETVATVSDGLVTAVAAGTATIYVCINETFYDACIVNVTDTELQAITMSSDTLTLTEGESATLSVTCVPASLAADLTLTWSSSDETVATVSEDGTVTALAAGTATITAKTEDGIQAECRVTVEAIPRYTVTFDSDLGDTEQEITDIPAGTTIELPDAPERSGYYFSGWFTEKNGQGTSFTSATPVTESLTVYAYWTLGRYYEGFEVEDIPTQTYTGSAVKPEPVIYDGGRLLVKDQDYTLSYKNNTRVGTGQVIVRGKGNYNITMTMEFEITPQDLASSAITATAADKVTTATVLDEDDNLLTKWYSYPTLRNGTATLRRSTDYTVDGFTVANDDAENAYTVTVTLTGIGNYTGTRKVTYRITGKSISGVLTTVVAAQTYTGSALEPEIAVYANSVEKNAGNPLAEGTDYTVEYENNTAVGTGKIILTGIGEYSGTKTITFRINKKGLAASKTDTDEITVQLRADETADWVTPSEYSAKYSGSAQKPYVQVIYKPSGSEDNDAVTLAEGTDYRLSWKNNVNAVQTTTKSSSYPTVTITGLGNYSGSRSVTFEIAPLELTEDNTKITVSDVQYTAAVGRSGAKPSVTVKVTLDGGDTWTTLKSGTAYTVVSYADNTSVGENAKVYIAGKGNYTTAASLERTFRIYESAANSLYVTVTAPTANSGMVYTGDKIEPTVSVYKNKTDQRKKTNALTENTDYTVSYANNINAGSSAQVLVSGLGTYGGTKTVTFRIARQSLAGGSVNPYADGSSSYTYTGSAISLTGAQLSVTDSNGNTLSLGTDYTASYRNNTNAGTAQITVTGKGNYSGSLTGSFTISPLTLTDENTTISVSDVKYTAAIGRSGAKPTVTVKVKTDAGKTLTLKKNTAYTVSYSGNKEIGSATVSITGKGNFSTTEDSEPSEQFRIYKNATSSLYVVLEDSSYYYSGSQIKPTISVYTKKSGVLLDESCYTVEYGTNTNIGTGKIYITGVEDYGGTKTVNFTILPKWLKWFL